MTRVVVVGAGVVGLACALELRAAGHEVTVLAAARGEDTTSSRAAAIWYPFEVAPAERVLPWSVRTRDRLLELSADPAAGIALRRGRILHRRPDPELDWVDVLPEHTLRPARPGDPAGVTAVSECALPIIDMSRHLPWLEDRVRAAGAPILDVHLGELEEARAYGEVIVAAVGLAARELLGDASVEPIRGQVARLANPGLTEFTLDDDNPAGLSYVIPRGADVVCGGTAQHGAEGLEPDPATESAILERTRALVPEIAESPVVSRAVGLRPGRPEVRLERVDTAAGPIVYNYGHGGAGVTLAWGCAEEVAGLLA